MGCAARGSASILSQWRLRARLGTGAMWEARTAGAATRSLGHQYRESVSSYAGDRPAVPMCTPCERHGCSGAQPRHGPGSARHGPPSRRAIDRGPGQRRHLPRGGSAGLECPDDIRSNRDFLPSPRHPCLPTSPFPTWRLPSTASLLRPQLRKSYQSGCLGQTAWCLATLLCVASSAIRGAGTAGGRGPPWARLGCSGPETASECKPGRFVRSSLRRIMWRYGAFGTAA